MRRLVRLYGDARRLIQAALLLLFVAGAAPASAADKLILALGDSLTAGYGLPQNQSFPAQLQAALAKEGVRARVHNAGVSGDTTAQGRSRLGWVLKGIGAKPDLAIVELGANDMLRGMKPEIARANLDATLAELKRRGIPVLLAGMRSAPNLGGAYAARFEPIYPQLAKKYGAALYPFFMEGVAGNRALQLPDRLHPNARGVAVIVRGILPSVKAALR